MLSWLKWWLWDSRRCQHVPGEWTMRDFGMGKSQHCKKCGKCMGLI